MEQLDLVFTDGGRHKYFKAGNVEDCVSRAIAIATKTDYKAVYDELRTFLGYTPRNGVEQKDTRRYMAAKGYKWVSLSGIGKGVTAHLAKNEIPMSGRIICKCSRHLVAVVDGVVCDTFDCRRGGTRAVYGYWIVK